jgi:hypothetical protein
MRQAHCGITERLRSPPGQWLLKAFPALVPDRLTEQTSLPKFTGIHLARMGRSYT